MGRMIEAFEADPDPLNVLSELALLRALLVDFLGRFDPKQRSDLDAARSLVDGISKVVARVERARAANAVSRADLFRILPEMGRIVAHHVEDSDALAAIKDDWLAIRL